MTAPLRIPITAESPELVPQYATSEAAGMDLISNEGCELAPGERRVFSTGIRVEIPPGFEGQVRPRSGLALRHGLSVPNAPGTIDADYRGEVKVILINLGNEPVSIDRGDRIAQLVVCPVTRVEWVQSPELEASARGDGGFGSTGVRG